MPLPALLLLIATLLPLASFTVLVFIGKRMGNPLSGYFGTLAIVGSFACSVAATFFWLNGGTYNGIEWGMGKNPIVMTMPWVPAGGGLDQEHVGFLDIGLYVDSLTVAMFSMVTFVAALVHLFSIGYMHEDKRFPRFFTYLGLFCFSMLGLVIGGTILQLFIFWELVGLCSYLLIGFWYEKKSASNAAIKAFVTNRVGDFGFLIGFGILFYHVGNVTLPALWGLLGNAGAGESIPLPGGLEFSAALLTIMGIGLFFGAIGKSAQFPLHVWLPDAMEGPTPVSALIHAATMVAAGVYLTARIFPILTPDAKLFIAIIGVTTLTMAALIALVQSDIKKVLAYSTLSQLGFMILAIGLGSYIGGLFHLITHAFFKALLFLGSGSVIHAAHHEQEMPQYGGLWRKIPVTAITFGVAVLAIAGFPWLSGAYSKAMLMTHAGAFAYLAEEQGKHWGYWLFYILPACIAFVTAFYMTRCWMLTFWGKPRNQHLYDHAHESPILYVPLVALAVMSILAGYRVIGVVELIENSAVEAQYVVDRLVPENPPSVFAHMWPEPIDEAPIADPTDEPHPANPPLVQKGQDLEHHTVFFAFVGILPALLMYFRGYWIADILMKFPPLRWFHTWLYRRMFFDELYHGVFVAIVMALSKFSAWFDYYIVDKIVNLAAGGVKRLSDLAGLHDKYVVDGAVNGAADLAQGIGAAVRAPQTGRIRMYVTILMLAIGLGLAGAIIVVLSL